MSTELFEEFKAKGFSHSLRGYNVSEINSYIEELLVYCRKMEKEIQKKERELVTYQEREDYLKSAILSAEKLAQEIRSDAEKEALIITERAKKGAEKIMAQAKEETEKQMRIIEETKREFDRLYGKYIQQGNLVVDKFRASAEKHMNSLKDEFIDEVMVSLENLDGEFKKFYKEGNVTSIKRTEPTPIHKPENIVGKTIAFNLSDNNGNTILPKGAIVTQDIANWIKAKGLNKELAAVIDE